jgi:uncharacterized protein (TIGR00106 family)
MTLMEFSMIPLDKGSSFSKYVARSLDIIDSSGLDYRLTPMGTVVEGEWDELLALLDRVYKAMAQVSDRISVSAKFDSRKGRSGRLESKIASVEKTVGRSLRKA